MTAATANQAGRPVVDTPAIRAIGVERSFGRLRAVAGASLDVPRGRLVALLGPSGSGKTTLLRTIAGFEAPDAGSVWIGGRRVAGEGSWEEPDRRRVGMVFQDGALFPHLTVADNVAFADVDRPRVQECLELVGLTHRAADYPHELSGGERQRIALARALAPRPEVVLLDEPFAALDPTLRVSLREEVAAILRTAGASALLVTHDQEEALSLADEVAVMRDGRIEQVGTPEDVYQRPATRWVASFLGDVDVVPGTATHGIVACDLGTFAADPLLDGPVEVLLRPESIIIEKSGSDGGGARIVRRAFYGHDQLVVLELPNGREIRSRHLGGAGWRVGDPVRLRVDGPISVLPSSAPDLWHAPPLTTA